MLAFLTAAFIFVVAPPPAAAPKADTNCGYRLFVSSWFSTVFVYDACTGAFIKELDSNARLNGAMAVRLGPDGLIYAVAETAGAIQRYRNDTLEFVDTFASVPGIGATGLAFDADGIAYVAGFDTDDVRKFDRRGVSLGTAVPARSSGLNGPDSGMTFGPDGNLYIPAYNSSSVVRFDPRTGQTSVAVTPGAGGLFQTRGILPDKDGKHLFITSEGSGQLLRWDIQSGQLVTLRSGVTRPTGIDYAPDGNLFLTHGVQVLKVDPATGATIAPFIGATGSGVSTQVFLSVLPTPSATTAVDTSQVGTQFWVVGTAAMSGRVLAIDPVFTATGTGFGTGLRFADLSVKRWGSVRIEFVSCTEARFSWDSTGTNSAGFGTGSYSVYRYFENEATARCTQAGIDAADKSWVNGQWWGRDARAGEGWFLDRGTDGTTFFAWFTHRPR